MQSVLLPPPVTGLARGRCLASAPTRPTVLLGYKCAVVDSRSELGSASSDVECKFARIASQLVALAGQTADDNEAIDDGLLPFGVSPEEAAAVQTEQQSSKSTAEKKPGVALGFASVQRGNTSQIPNECLPKIAIVGRPNVGKSALFNRLAGASVAVVFDEPGVTRDRLYTRAMWGNTEFIVIDTGGLTSDASHLPVDVRSSVQRSVNAQGLPAAIERQAAAGVAEADCVVLLVDGKAGLQTGDRDVLDWLRSNHPGKPLRLAVNKCDNVAKADMMLADFWELGMEPFPLSAITGTGTAELLESIMQVLPPPNVAQGLPEETPLSVAIVGRPNVGKSSLLNAMCGEERVIVCDMSGTTRDAVDTDFTLPSGQKLKLIDTAGIRKRTRVACSKDGPEQLSVDRALRSIRKAEVVVALIDASEGITQQDFRLTEMAAQEGRAVVVVVNKWDKVDTRLWTEEKYVADVRAQLRHVSWATVVCTTASSGKAMPEVVQAILDAGTQHRRRVSTATLNMVLNEATAWKAPPTQRKSSRKGRIYYATQAAIQPPTFVFFVNDATLFGDDYKRYMERALRDNVGLQGTSLRIMWRSKPEKARGRLAASKAEAASKADAQAEAAPET
ncbi:P-loop containing nucleoside triphosphate hydrolase protein [Haematococcus lacustris]